MASRLAPVIRCLGVGQCKRSTSRMLLSQIRVVGEQYSTGVKKEDNVLTSPFADVDIPDVSYCKYIFDAQEKFGGYTALVSSRILTTDSFTV